MVFCCDLKLATGCVVAEVSWEVLQCGPRSAVACDWPGATLQGLQSSLWMLAACAGLGAAQQNARGTVRLATACQLLSH